MKCNGCSRERFGWDLTGLVHVWTNKLWCYECAHGIQDLRKERLDFQQVVEDRSRDSSFDRQEFFHYLRTMGHRNDVTRFLHYHRAWKDGRGSNPFWSPMCGDITEDFFQPVNGKGQ